MSCSDWCCFRLNSTKLLFWQPNLYSVVLQIIKHLATISFLEYGLSIRFIMFLIYCLTCRKCLPYGQGHFPFLWPWVFWFGWSDRRSIFRRIFIDGWVRLCSRRLGWPIWPYGLFRFICLWLILLGKVRFMKRCCWLLIFVFSSAWFFFVNGCFLVIRRRVMDWCRLFITFLKSVEDFRSARSLFL